MYLKSIEISGFKSFATKTDLSFPASHDGRFSITAIVGPNGSGKSNISDAIRWVMGEQSMKQLRGKKGSDIIFSGSDAKGKMSVASVSLILDNSDGRADIEFDELVLTRKLYRSGESEYIINGKQVRLLDVHLLLAKAQFGQGSYSVIGQGVIDRLLLQTAEERKAFFDEAAGIKEFQIKRHQAMLKLRRSREHMEQADLLLSEITPRLKTLSRQVKKLEERQTVELSLREMQEQYYTTLWTQQKTLLDSSRLELGKTNKEYKALDAELLTVQEELATLAKEASRQDLFVALQDAYQKIVQKKNILERDRAVLQGRLQTEYAKAGKHNVTWLENKIDALKHQTDDIEKDAEKMKTTYDRLEKEVHELRESLSQYQVERTQLQGTLTRLKQQQFEKRNEQSLWQLTGKRAVQAILNHAGQFGQVSGAVAQLGSVKKEFQLALDVAAGNHLSSIVVKDDRVAERCIQYLRDHQLGFATFLPLNKIRARYMPQDIEEILGQQGVHGLAIDLVNFDDQFTDIFSYVLGATVVVENIEAARNIGIGRVRMVTIDGDILETSGSMKGGFRKKRNYGLSFSQDALVGDISDPKAQGEKIEEIQTELEEIQKNYEKIEIELRTAEAALEVSKEKQVLFEGRKQEIVAERSSLEQELSLHSMSPKDYDSVMKDVNVKKDAVDNDIEKIEKELLAAQKKIAKFNDDEEKKKQRVFSLQEHMQTKQRELNAVMDERNKQQVVIAKLETKQEDLEHEAYVELHESLPSIVERTEIVLDIAQLEQTQLQIQKLKYKLSLIGGIDDEVVEEHQETKERHESLSEQLTDLTKAIDDLEILIAELDTVMKKRRAKAFKKIRKEFTRYFKLLFEGGKADLIEVYGEEKDEEIEDEEQMQGEHATEKDFALVEETEEKKKKRKKKVLRGIDIIASPPGKKIANIQVLSGGERTMTAIALVCAILHTNPSPFVVLDEVEAALDEANTVRFTQIIKELAKQSQFILITHNRATMHAADSLYGVTMGNDGISKLLSVNMA